MYLLALCTKLGLEGWMGRREQWGGSPGGVGKPRSPALQADSLPAEPQGKPKNTRVGSLSLLQRIFPTQVSNLGLLHCRQIIYQLSYQGSPKKGLVSKTDKQLLRLYISKANKTIKKMGGRPK